MQVYRAVNALTVKRGPHEVTFWYRAQASVGKFEWWRTECGLSFQLCLWGWSVSTYTDRPTIDGYWRGRSFNFPWAAYDRNRGGVFCWRWLRSLRAYSAGVRAYNMWNAQAQWHPTEEEDETW